MSEREPSDGPAFDVVDDEAEQTPEEKRLREVRLRKSSLRKADAGRGRAMLMAGAVALGITSLLCLGTAWQRLTAGSTAAGVGLITFSVSAAFLGWLCLSAWRRS